MDQALVGNRRHEYAVQRRDQSPLLRMQRRAVVDGANAGYRTPRYLTFKQALELGGNVRKGEHGTKVYFVKQLQVADRNGEEGETRIVPMMREYTVFNVDQCEGLPDRVLTLGEVKVRNTDQRDATIDEFLGSSGVEIREGMGEAYYRPGADFISLPRFEAFKSAALFTRRRFMSWATRQATSRALIVTCAVALVRRHTLPRN